MIHIVNFVSWHAKLILESTNVLAGVDCTQDDILRAYTSEGSLARTMLDGELPVACGGIFNLKFRRGEAWVLPGKLARYHGLSIVRSLRKFLPELAQAGGFRRVQATCCDEKTTKLFKLLGFQYEGAMRCYGPQGQIALMYSRIFL